MNSFSALSKYFFRQRWLSFLRNSCRPIQVSSIAECRPKARYSSSWEPHLRATGRHLPYGITQC